MTGIAADATVTVAPDDTHFVVDFMNTIDPPNGFFSGELADATGLSRGVAKVGAAQETIADALGKISGFADSYFLALESSIIDTVDAGLAAAWAAGSERVIVRDSPNTCLLYTSPSPRDS